MTSPPKTILNLTIERLKADIASRQASLNRLDRSLASFASAEEILLRMKRALALLTK
jgi:hypothetical protein